MRLPRLRDLTEEQKRVYLYAPTDRHVLVHGPPGTGKTLIACLRAIELEQRNLPVVLGMFSRVLTRYSSNAGEDRPMPSRTVLQWFQDWWRASGLPPHPSTPRHIIIQVPFEEKDRAAAAGARWHPREWRPWRSRGRGAWAVDYERYTANREVFQGWPLWHSPPCVDGNEYRIDWSAVTDHLMEHEESLQDSAFDVGMLIIDEGQDFAEGFYRFLWQVSALSTAPGRQVGNRLRCFVLADENQQITEDNSTLTQIASALRIGPDESFELLDNFRNSREIAELARSFFADVGVLPRLPTRTAAKPVYTVVPTHAEVANRIKTWLNNNPRKEVGVFTFQDETRAGLHQLLNNTLAAMRGRNVEVQTYSWRSRAEHRADALLFDTPDVVTVLNMQSCKGLEFDAVFIVDPHDAAIGTYGIDRFRMQMFVAVSRARDWVTLIDSGTGAGTGGYMDHLPPETVLEREHPAGQADPGHWEEGAPAASRGGHGSTAVPMDWERQLRERAREERWVCFDLRSKKGAFWVIGGSELAAHLEPLGFRFSPRRTAWWRK